MRQYFNFFKDLAFSRTAKSTYLVTVGNAATIFSAFIFTILVARNISPSGFGVLSTLITFSYLLADVSDFGVGWSLLRFLPPLIKKGKNKEVKQFLKLAFMIEIILAVTLSFLLFFFSHSISLLLFKNTTLWRLISLCSFAVFFTMMFNFLVYALSSYSAFFQVALMNIIFSLARLLTVTLFFYIGKLDLYSSFLIFVFMPAVGVLAGFLFLSLDFLKERTVWKEVGKLFSFSSFLALGRFFSAISSKLDILMLAYFAGSFNTGIYAVAYKIVSIYPFLVGSFAQVVTPRLSSSSFNELSSFFKKLLLTTAGILVSVVVFYILAFPIVFFFFGQNYLSSVSALKGLLLAFLPFIAGMPFINLLIFTFKKPQFLAINTFLQLVLIFVLNLYFIPRYLLFGPIYSLGVAYLVTFFTTAIPAVYYFSTKKPSGMLKLKK